MSIEEKIREGVYNNQVKFVLKSKDPVGWQSWFNECIRTEALFRADAIKDCGLEGHPEGTEGL